MQRVFTSDVRSHGKGPILYAWHPNSQYIAYVGSSRVVNIIDCSGKLVDSVVLSMSTACIAIEWDPAGEILACLQENSPSLILWYMNIKRLETIELGLKEPSFMKWSESKSILSIGTGRGDLLLYNPALPLIVSNSQIPQNSVAFNQNPIYVGKHKKRITCGAFSDGLSKLCFCSDDRQITICTQDGVTIGQVKVKTKPTRVKFGSSNLLSISLDKKCLLLYNLSDPDNALELAFQTRYGNICSWSFKREYMVVAFSLGYVVVISTKAAEIGREQFCAKYHSEYLKDLSISNLYLATCGDCIKLINMNTWKEFHTELPDKDGSFENLSFSPDGQFLGVTTRSSLVLFNTAAPVTPTHSKSDEWSTLLLSLIIIFCLVLLFFVSNGVSFNFENLNRLCSPPLL